MKESPVEEKNQTAYNIFLVVCVSKSPKLVSLRNENWVEICGFSVWGSFQRLKRPQIELNYKISLDHKSSLWEYCWTWIVFIWRGRRSGDRRSRWRLSSGPSTSWPGPSWTSSSSLTSTTSIRKFWSLSGKVNSLEVWWSESRFCDSSLVK